MITIVGVGHVFDIKNAVRRIILDRRPNIVCVELDQDRYYSLLESRKNTKLGAVPLGYRLLSSFQEKIARKYNSRPGDEMIAAVDTAKYLGIDVAFIDMDASFVFKNLWNNMTFEERVKLMATGFFGFFAGKKHIDKELKKFEDNQDDYMAMFESEYPSIKKFLIDDRNKHMANAITEVNKKYPNIVAIIGDGHVDGITKILDEMHPEIIRLRELLTKTWKEETNTSMTVSFTIEQKK